MDPCSVLSTLV